MGPARTVPTLWIVLGPLGQSITATGLLAHAASTVIPKPYSTATQALAVLYGTPVWGFAILWLMLAAAITLRTARQHLPFCLTWWSFTFPVGTLVTGTSELAIHTHASFLTAASIALYAFLIGAWLTAASRTAHGAVRGRLFLPTPPVPTAHAGTTCLSPHDATPNTRTRASPSRASSPLTPGTDAVQPAPRDGAQQMSPKRTPRRRLQGSGRDRQIERDAYCCKRPPRTNAPSCSAWTNPIVRRGDQHGRPGDPDVAVALAGRQPVGRSKQSYPPASSTHCAVDGRGRPSRYPRAYQRVGTFCSLQAERTLGDDVGDFGAGFSVRARGATVPVGDGRAPAPCRQSSSSEVGPA